ncbi:hypothetical protein J6590_004372 [Homalodisca vitripennis]|nr:hypothetical protein J6590_004372 [Homalodisca vitripennis]
MNCAGRLLASTSWYWRSYSSPLIGLALIFSVPQTLMYCAGRLLAPTPWYWRSYSSAFIFLALRSPIPQTIMYLSERHPDPNNIDTIPMCTGSEEPVPLPSLFLPLDLDSILTKMSVLSVLTKIAGHLSGRSASMREQLPGSLYTSHPAPISAPASTGPPRTLFSRLGIRKPSLLSLASPLVPPAHTARTFSLDDLLKPPARSKKHPVPDTQFWDPALYMFTLHFCLTLCLYRPTASSLQDQFHIFEQRINTDKLNKLITLMLP